MGEAGYDVTVEEFDQCENIVFVVDMLMEVIFVQGVIFVEQICSEDFGFVSIFEDVF